MIHETQTDSGKWLELDPGVQRIIAIAVLKYIVSKNQTPKSTA